jgi:hypothetical protein
LPPPLFGFITELPVYYDWGNSLLTNLWTFAAVFLCTRNKIDIAWKENDLAELEKSSGEDARHWEGEDCSCAPPA